MPVSTGQEAVRSATGSTSDEREEPPAQIEPGFRFKDLTDGRQLNACVVSVREVVLEEDGEL